MPGEWLTPHRHAEFLRRTDREVHEVLYPFQFLENYATRECDQRGCVARVGLAFPLAFPPPGAPGSRRGEWLRDPDDGPPGVACSTGQTTRRPPLGPHLLAITNSAMS